MTEHESQLHAEYFERYRKVGRSLLQQAAEAFSEPEQREAPTPDTAETAAPLEREAALPPPMETTAAPVSSPAPIALSTENTEPTVSNGAAAASTTRRAQPAASTADGTPSTGEASALTSKAEHGTPAEQHEPHASVTNRILARAPAQKPRPSDAAGSQQLVSSLRRRVLGANAAAQTAARTNDGSTRLLGSRDGALARFRRRRFGV